MRSFPAIRIEGGFFAPDLLDQVLASELPGQRPGDFGLDGRRNLTDEIAAAFADARALWGVFQHRLERLSEADLATSVTRDAWVIPFLGLLGYELRYNQRAYLVDGLSFAISHRAGETEDAPPVHVVGARQELGRVSPTGRPRLAPHSLLQEYLNRTEHLWGIVTNGERLRLLRDSTYIRKQAYIEFNLTEIIEEQRFQDFAVLYRLLHRTRLPQNSEDASRCLLEQYYQHSVEQGGRVRDHLRDGVEACIKKLANGFLHHPKNVQLRAQVVSNESSLPGEVSQRNGQSPLNAEELYHQLLRLVYRFLFLLVSEDRGLISPNPLYREHYGVSRLRRLLEQHAAFTEHDDLWQSLRVLWKVLCDEKLAGFLQAAPLNGELFAPLDLDENTITNRDLLEAFWHLVYYQETPASMPRKVNYAALDVEELGSVYESLLEFQPQIISQGQIPVFDLIPIGEERRTTGSHYTPTELVNPLIQHALDPVIADRLKSASTKEEKETALLSIKVCDLACGSGHFLLAAARRLGKELARVETNEDEPAPERIREAIRRVIAHCIYGVDKNPLAVELCRVALWLESHESGKPLTFLEHRIRCGDSIVGMTDLEQLNQGIPDVAYKPLSGDNRDVAKLVKKLNATERGDSLFAGKFREVLEKFAQTLWKMENLPENTIAQVSDKAEAFQRWKSSREYQQLQIACHLWTGAFFQNFTDDKIPPITTGTMRQAFLSGRLHDGRLSSFFLPLVQKYRFFHWHLEFPEVFVQGGFDVIIGNPPFMGGLKISGTYGNKYRRWLEVAFDPYAGTADLCATFFRQAFRLLKPGGRIGLIATNTIGQGDTRESGLSVILKEGGKVTFARRFVKWPGRATVEVNLVALHKHDHHALSAIQHSSLLDDQPVDFISSRLDDMPEAEPRRLKSNAGKAFIGSYVLGMGFTLEPEEARCLMSKDPRNSDCLFPYLNGADLNSHPEQKPRRWVINFFDWDIEKVHLYPNLLCIVEDKVKPEREKLRDSIPTQARRKKFWWQYGSAAPQLYATISTLHRVLVRATVSDTHAMVFVPKGWIYGHKVIVFAFDDYFSFSVLQSLIHEIWMRRFTSTMRTDVNYSPSDCFETFPFPQNPSLEDREQAEQVGAEYHEHRRQIMLSRQLGLTKTYNLFHDPSCTDSEIVRLRELHAEMDRAIARCYGWEDLDLGHGFYENERGKTRFTISLEARREVLRRLVELNLELARSIKG